MVQNVRSCGECIAVTTRQGSQTIYHNSGVQVRDSELQNPAKLLPATGKILTTPGGPVAPAEETTPGVSDEGSSAPIGRLMYGRWQTEPYKPPAVVDGKVILHVVNIVKTLIFALNLPLVLSLPPPSPSCASLIAILTALTGSKEWVR